MVSAPKLKNTNRLNEFLEVCHNVCGLDRSSNSALYGNMKVILRYDKEESLELMTTLKKLNFSKNDLQNIFNMEFLTDPKFKHDFKDKEARFFSNYD